MFQLLTRFNLPPDAGSTSAAAGRRVVDPSLVFVVTHEKDAAEESIGRSAEAGDRVR